MSNNTKITKMPFEKHSYILSGEVDWFEMRVWLNDNNISWRIQGNILTFNNDQDESFFLLRFYNG
jgi:hypothetical protein